MSSELFGPFIGSSMRRASHRKDNYDVVKRKYCTLKNRLKIYKISKMLKKK